MSCALGAGQGRKLLGEDVGHRCDFSECVLNILR